MDGYALQQTIPKLDMSPNLLADGIIRSVFGPQRPQRTRRTLNSKLNR